MGDQPQDVVYVVSVKPKEGLLLPCFYLWLMASLYRSYRDFLQERFPGYRQVRKVTLDAGFTCPNMDGTKARGGCTYCDNRSFSPALAMRGDGLSLQLDTQILRLRTRFPHAGVLAYFQPYSNTYAPAEVLAGIFEQVLDHPDVVGISVGTRPDCLPADVIDVLCRVSRRKPLILEIGLQTANDATLLRTNRGHSLAEFREGVARCVEAVAAERGQGFPGFDLCTHLIVGLPGEGMADFENTARVVSEYPFSAVKIHPLHIVKGTRMALEWERGNVTILEFEAYCQAVARMMSIFPKNLAIERFSGDAPSDQLLAPSWCGDRNAIVTRVEEILRGRQGEF